MLKVRRWVRSLPARLRTDRRIDLDTVKNPAAGEWWRRPDHGRELWCQELETWRRGVWIGRRAHLFRYPAGFAMPTVKTAIGVDLRGQGGFLVLPPSLTAAAGLVMGATAAPLAVRSGHRARMAGRCDRKANPAAWRRAAGRERTASEAEFNSFGRRIDGRETYMADTVWAALIDRHREWHSPGPPPVRTVEEWARAAFAVYCDNVGTRLAADGTSEEDRLEREGRGWTAFDAKWRAAFRKWDTVIAEEARKPKDEPAEEQPSPGAAADRSSRPAPTSAGGFQPAAPAMALWAAPHSRIPIAARRPRRHRQDGACRSLNASTW